MEAEVKELFRAWYTLIQIMKWYHMKKNINSSNQAPIAYLFIDIASKVNQVLETVVGPGERSDVGGGLLEPGCGEVHTDSASRSTIRAGN